MPRGTAEAAVSPARLSGDALLEKITPTKRRADCYVVLNARLLDEWETEDAKLRQMRADEVTGQGQRLATSGEGSAEVKRQARKVQKIEKQLEDEQMHFVFENMSPDEHSALAAAHPPRRDVQFDALVGYNREAVARESVRLCLVEPEFSDAGWERLMAVIPPGEWSELVQTCDRANGRVGQLPKSPVAASLLRGRNGLSSTSPGTGG